MQLHLKLMMNELKDRQARRDAEHAKNQRIFRMCIEELRGKLYPKQTKKGSK